MNDAALARLPFLHGLPTPTINAVRRVLRPLSVPAGTVLFRTGDEGDACYFIDTGAMRVTTSPAGEVLVTLGPGSFVGELALLLGEPRSATVTAVTDVRLFALKRADLESLLAVQPDIALAMTRELSRHLAHAYRRLSGDFGARRSVVWPARMVGPIVAAIDATATRLGVAALKGASIGATPSGAERVRAPLFGANEAHLQSVVIGAPDLANAPATLAIADAEHVLAFGPPPQWLVDAAPADRLIRLKEDDVGLRRAARWATGRAVGLVLSSGGSKTVAHLGVIRVLLAAGVEIDAVAGTSGGAFSAAALAFDRGEDFMQQNIADFARATNWRRLDFNFPPRSGLFKGRRLRAMFEKWGHDGNLEDADIPLWLIAADVATGGQVVLHTGPVADSIRASMSIPGALDPWRIGDRVFIDGGVVNPLPTDVLRDAGVGVVIASNVAGQASEIVVGNKLPGFMQIMGRILNTMEREVIRAQLPLADVVIRPRVTASNSFDFSKSDEMIAAGVEAARQRLPDIEAVLHAAGVRAKVPE